MEADLSQVYSYVRENFSVGINFGWFQIPLVDYQSVIENMTKDTVLKLKFEEGSLEFEKYGRQIFEMGKQIFEAMNAAVNAREGLFEFRPNPTPPETTQPTAGRWWGWTLWMNAAYGKQSIESTQKTHYKNTLEYSGRFWWPIGSSMSLATKCNEQAADYYTDLNDPDNPCITAAKLRDLEERRAVEKAKKRPKAELLLDQLIDGEITYEEYDQRMNRLYEFSYMEDLTEVPAASLGHPLPDGRTLEIPLQNAVRLRRGRSENDLLLAPRQSSQKKKTLAHV